MARQRPWGGLDFSAEKLSDADVTELLILLPPKAYCAVEDRSVHLDADRLKGVAKRQGVSLDIRKDWRSPGYR